MPAVTKVPLGAATLVRKWSLDINTGTDGAPTWIGLFGMTDFKFDLAPVMKDDSDLDSSGWKSESATAIAWSIETKVERKVIEGTPTSYNPGQEYLRAKALLIGTLNHVQVRFYEMTSGGPKVEAFKGWCSVQWKPDGGSMEDHDTVTVTLSGQGELTAITHPDGAQIAPVVYSITPNTGSTAGGDLVIIKGIHFMLSGVDDVVATTGVQLAAHNFTDWTVLDNYTIAATTPAETAVTSPVKVTNSAGASNTDITFTCS